MIKFGLHGGFTTATFFPLFLLRLPYEKDRANSRLNWYRVMTVMWEGWVYRYTVPSFTAPLVLYNILNKD